MTRSLADVRLDESATCRYVLFVEGLPDAYTTDESGGLVGSGLGSWIGLSETAIGGSEVFGTRRVLPGLNVPDTITFEIDPRTGALQPSPASFRLLDDDENSLSTLFASEGKDFDVLGERIAPGTTALGVSVGLFGGVLTTNPRGKYIGIERIGPSGQRRFLPAIPFSLVGFDHAVAPHLPPTWISSSPLVFAGRMVTLYRVYKLRPELDDSDPTAWATWDDCHDAGDLVWCGVLRDAGNIAGNRMWSIDCHGFDGLTRRMLGTRNTSRWMKISADLTLDASQIKVGIGFMSHASGAATTAGDTYYNASIFAHSITEGTRSGICSELNTWIEQCMSGASTNVAHAGGNFNTWDDTTGEMNEDAGVNSEGVFFIRREEATSDEIEYGAMFITLHERVWRMLGWEPERQHLDGVVFSDLTRCQFKRHESGEQFKWPAASGIDVPADGYWTARFDTITPGFDRDSIGGYDNDGNPRYYYPMHTAPVFVLNHDAAQTVRLLNEGTDSVYLEGQLTAGIESASNEVDEDPVELGRWFALRGEYIISQDDPTTDDKIEVSEVKSIHLVAKGEWLEGTRHGDVGRGTLDLYPSIRLAYYQDPRAWGWNNRRLSAGWAGKLEGKGEIEIAPLHAYNFSRYTKPFECAGDVWAAVMLSTGSASGWSNPHDVGGTFTCGANSEFAGVGGAEGDLGTFGDIELADLGLGIPYQLVADSGARTTAFDTVPGGYFGNLNRVRLGYVGPFQAADVLDSIMRSRRLCWSLHGKRLGLFAMGPVSPEDVDIEVLEDDLYGDPLDPTSCIPSQNLRATGQLDRIDLEYRFDADNGKPVLLQKFAALDAGALQRTGELVEVIRDDGLCPPWFGEKQELITGVGDWRQAFRQHWAYDACEFFAKRHFSVELTLSRPKGQDAMPGSAVAITNPWLVNPAGGYGITGRTGRIIRATHNLQQHSTTIEAIVFAGESVLHYAPAVRIQSVDSSGVVTWYDYLGTDNDGLGLGMPDWWDPDNPADAEGHIFQRDGNTWTRVHTGSITNVDLATRTCTIAGLPSSAVLRDKDKWLVIGGPETGSPGWADGLFGVQTDSALAYEPFID